MLDQRLKNRISIKGDCWYWLGKPTMYGYGQISYKGEWWRAHRLIYTILVGVIPEGKHLDHLCRNRLCVNPDHLEPVSSKENVLRGDGLTAVNAKKTKCHRGHLLTGDNLYITPRGYRNCRECLKLTRKKWHNRVRKAQEAQSGSPEDSA